MLSMGPSSHFFKLVVRVREIPRNPKIPAAMGGVECRGKRLRPILRGATAEAFRNLLITVTLAGKAVTKLHEWSDS